MSAKGTSANALGIETLFFSGIGGSLMQIKFKGILEKKKKPRRYGGFFMIGGRPGGT